MRRLHETLILLSISRVLFVVFFTHIDINFSRIIPIQNSNFKQIFKFSISRNWVFYKTWNVYSRELGLYYVEILYKTRVYYLMIFDLMKKVRNTGFYIRMCINFYSTTQNNWNLQCINNFNRWTNRKLANEIKFR